MDWASKFADKVIDAVLGLTIRHVGYIIYYRENVNELKGLVEDLRLARERVKHAVDKAENNLGTTEGDVRKWIQDVEKTRTKTDGFLNDEGNTKPGCSSGLLPYLWKRHKLGREAKEKAADVKKLLKPEFGEVSYRQHPTSMDVALSNAGYEDFDSRKYTREEIMKKLKDSTVKMIGVHGPGGVGKSTLIKEIAKDAQDKKLFNVVVRVEVTRNPNLRKMQEEIAYLLGLRLEAEGETVRADRLRRRLKEKKENSTLIIMDDLWDKIDLNKIGIPFDDDDGDDDLSRMIGKDMKDRRDLNTMKIPHDDDDCTSHMTIKDMKDPTSKMGRKEKSLGDYKGCKILLTSRVKEVLSDKMDVNDKSIFCVGKLNDEDSLMLFTKVSGIPDEMPQFILPEIVKYCGGLPMAIVTVGRALKDKSVSTWETTLEKLKKEELSGVQKSMEISVKMSYDHLESEELKSIFLLCAQMGRQQLTTDLAKYCFGLGILEGIYTIGEARERIFTSIQKLTNSNLMQVGSSSDRFDMHDMVRDAALSIAHKEQNVFALRNGKLDDWPDKDELEKCTAISIRNCDIIDELPEVLNCPQLKFFQIDSDDPSLRIPKNFFEGMKKLRILILTGFHLQCLPSSIECLLNLRMLCLERCILDDNLSIIGNRDGGSDPILALSPIGKLKKLRILSFSGSKIGNLPAELGCLDKLQLFDISDCSIRKGVQPNFMSRWICLEELYIRKSLIKMEAESQISFLSQLKHLHQLRVVDLCIPGAAVLPSELFFDRLNDYKIVTGDLKMLSVGDFRMPNKYEALRSLALQLTNGTDIHSQKGLMLLFKKVENLLLGELNGVQNAFCELNMDGFPDLKHLSIVDNIGIEYIINSMELSHPQSAFPNLESLCLYRLTNIKTICYTPAPDDSFTKLKTIKIKMCTQLKNLFSFYMVKFLTSLETVDVSECGSLKEIVFKEGQAYSSDKVEFHKLRSLTLQSLPSFSSFYSNVEMPSVEGQAAIRDHMEIITIAEEDKHSGLVPLTLFGVLVGIPNLESLELSSINSHKIWSDQPLSSSCFQNLTKLTVKDCHNLGYLCSLSVASSLNKLKGLFISGCRKMERIFNTEGNSVEKAVCVFPKLEEICLTKLDMLTDIWQAAEVGDDSFSSLISVQIERCDKLDKIFPSHMTGWFRSLESLKVVGCMSVELIFEIKDTQKKDASGSVTDTKLQLIHVDSLPSLRQIWGRDPGGILSFKNLRSIGVAFCGELRHVLPGSVAKEDLKSLESISVRFCDKMEEIVAWEDGSETPLKFPEVTYMQLYRLPNISRFYKGGHIVCPKLKKLSVAHCEKLETFAMSETTTEERKPIFYAEKVISNLEIMVIDSKEALWLQSNHGKCLMHRLKDLTLYLLSSIDILYWLLHRMPNLESLTLFNDENIEELVPRRIIVPQERLGTVLQLKKLNLRFSDIKDLGLERDPVLQRLEHLVLYFCDDLINLAPSSVSLTHLTYLEVTFCFGLTNLMASSTAKSMVQLATMKVIGCDKLKEIVTNEGNEEGGVIEVVFSKLISIELVRLQNLTSFCSYKNCQFKFPSLERLIVTECPRMVTFTESYTTAPKLQNILAVEGEEKEKAYWEGDLNATIQKVFKDMVSFEYTEHLNLSDDPELLERVWHRNDLVHENMFRNLKTLTISAECSDLVHVIPSHLLPCLGNLEELTVWDCRAVQVIFNINDTRLTKAMGTFRLKKLYLYNLPKLEHVWDKDPEGIFGLQLLHEISVNSCGSLKSLFPASVAKDLTRLEELRVTDCKELVEIFSKDEKAAEGGATKEFVFRCLTSLDLYFLPKLEHVWDKDPEGIFCLQKLQEISVERCDTLKSLFPASVANKDLTRLQVLRVKNCKELVEIFSKDERAAEGATKEFVFPCLTSLELTYKLPALKYFYPGLHKLECPLLQKISLNGLAEEQALIQIEKVIQIPCLKILSFGIGDTMVIWNQESWALQFRKPQRFQEETGSVLYRFLVMLSKIEKLELRKGSLEEVFSVERPNADYTRVLLHLKELKLIDLDNLTSIGLEHSWLHPIPENLQILKIEYCARLENLVPRTVSFSNLTCLQVLKCKRLLYLFTSSTAKSLCLLKEMKIEGCESVEEIVSTEGDESHEDEKLIFGQLHTLFLKDLPKLRCFYRGNFALCFPSLEKVSMIRCSWMKAFCPVNRIDPTKLSAGITFVKDATPRWEGDLNSTVRKRFVEEITECAQKVQVSLEDEPLLQGIWQGSLPVPDMFFSNLVSLTVNGCQFLSEVLPSNLLPYLTKLEKLEVRNCIYVKTIFDVKRITEDRKMTTTGDASLPFPFSLKTLTLDELPNLENVWNQDPHGILRVQLLEEVYVDKCKCLTSLFPASVAKDLVKLENLHVKHCKKLMVIVAEDNTIPRGTKSMQEMVSTEGDESHEDEKIIFEQLRALYLKDLQELKCFYSGNFTLCFPSLEEVFVINCHKMETFCPGIINADKLLGVKFHDEADAIPLENDLNSTIRKASLVTIPELAQKIRVVRLRDEPPLQEIWQGSLPVPDMCFSNLEHLIVDGCDFLSEVLPSNLLPFLTKMKRLEVRNCSSVKTIFDVKGITEDRKMTTTGDASLPLLFSLKILILEELPNLENVWNEDPHGILRVQLLEEVYVGRCKCLTSLFPTSVAKDLVKLRVLVVEHCEELMVIVAEDNADPRGTKSMQEIVSTEGEESQEDEKIIFEQLWGLGLGDLQELKCFYSGNFTLCFPSLEEVFVINCHKMETFCSGTINADKLLGVKFEIESDAIPLENDLNSTIRKAFLATSELDSNNSAKGYIGRGD